MTAARRLLVVAGLLTIGYAVTGASADPDLTFGVLIFLAAVVILHDGVVLPMTLLTRYALRRWCPAGLRPYLAGVLVTAAAVTVVALPLLLGPGRLLR